MSAPTINHDPSSTVPVGDDVSPNTSPTPSHRSLLSSGPMLVDTSDVPPSTGKRANEETDARAAKRHEPASQSSIIQDARKHELGVLRQELHDTKAERDDLQDALTEAQDKIQILTEAVHNNQQKASHEFKTLQSCYRNRIRTLEKEHTAALASLTQLHNNEVGGLQWELTMMKENNDALELNKKSAKTTISSLKMELDQERSINRKFDQEALSRAEQLFRDAAEVFNEKSMAVETLIEELKRGGSPQDTEEVFV
ncbi:hypothetical protein DL96DRAFT_1567275 [Flagelloscypha sp. PMI_526]|nr:hypothetical protein DL96DRAFT_1567275 [Flagelloscypha sp. PMI_526]